MGYSNITTEASIASILILHVYFPSKYEVAVYMYFTIITFFHNLQVLFFTKAYMVVFLFNTVIHVFLLLCLCILIVCLCIFIVPAGTLRLP